MKQHVMKQFFILSISEIVDGKVGCWLSAVGLLAVADLPTSDLRLLTWSSYYTKFHKADTKRLKGLTRDFFNRASLNLSTTKPLNKSTIQQINDSTKQRFNKSTIQQINNSTPKPFREQTKSQNGLCIAT
jgi:hypothetical protein